METRLRQKMKNFHCDQIVENQNPDHQVTIHELNDDCLTNIFMFLNIVDRVRIESVCKRWRDISKKSWQSIKALDDRVTILGFEIYNKVNRIAIYKKILQRCGPFLRRLDLHCLLTDKYILNSIGKMCPNLQYIDMQAVRLTLPAMKVLTKNCHNLREFSFALSTKEINDSEMSKFFKQKKQLKSLKITENSFLTGQCLSSLPVEMDSIVLEYCPNISNYCVSDALKQFKQLKTFSLITTATFDKDKHPLAPTLKTLEIQYFNLEKLVIKDVDLVTDAFLSNLAANCKKLHHLSIDRCCNVTDVGVQKVTCLPKLEHLSLKDLYNITDSALTYIPKVKQLLCWNGLSVKDNGICTLLETCDSLEVLDLGFCPQITNTLVECAMNVAKKRTNNVVLHLKLHYTSVDMRKFRKYPKETPHLKIWL